MRLYGEIINRTGVQTILYLTCTTISSLDLALYGVSRAKDWISVDCCTRYFSDFINRVSALFTIIKFLFGCS